MKRKRGGFNFATRTFGSMSNVVSGNRTPKDLSDEETKQKAMCFK